MRYYLKGGDGEKGPFSLARLRDSLADGEIKGSALIRAEDGETWIPLDAQIARDEGSAPEPGEPPPVAPKPRPAKARLGPGAARAVDPAARMRAAGEAQMALGAFLFLAGVVVTGVSVSLAQAGGGGTYVVATGAIVFGAVRFFRGRAQRKDSEMLEVLSPDDRPPADGGPRR